MWFTPSIKDEYVTIVLSPQYIVCSWIKQKKREVLCELKAYSKTELHNLECEKLIMFNPTVVKSYITHFLQQYALSDAFVMFLLTGPGILERIVTLNTSTPSAQDFAFPELKKMLWDYCYLYPIYDTQFNFYLCGTSRELLFQYKLLAIATHINLIAVRTKFIALLHLYRCLHGNAFRQSQLAVDMAYCTNHLENFFTSDDIKRMLSLHSDLNIDVEEEAPFLLSMLGLFLSRNEDGQYQFN